ncbi:MAG: LITAF-like zinc ribbon domain-containing protein [Promethearchaeota archaeon]
MPTKGFCPNCNQQVLSTRKDFNTCLAIVLLLFTGIGFFIYLAIYYSSKKDRCTECGAQLTFISPQISSFNQSQPLEITSREIKGAAQNYCALCGESLGEGIKICPNCGTTITKD